MSPVPAISVPPTLLAEGSVSNYIFFAFSTILVYDHALTFQLEVERIWTLKWRLPKVLFFINRYIILVLVLAVIIDMTVYPLTLNACQTFENLHIWCATVAMLSSELVLAIRVSALYSHDKIMLRFLSALYISVGISVVVLSGIVVEDLGSAVELHEYWQACPAPSPNINLAYWIPFATFDGIVIILTMYKVLAYREGMNPTIRLLARDSILYFSIMFSTLLFNSLFSAGKFTQVAVLTLPVECIACTAVARMMMNIRGLVFDDPYRPRELSLSTLKFQT